MIKRATSTILNDSLHSYSSSSSPSSKDSTTCIHLHDFLQSVIVVCFILVCNLKSLMLFLACAKLDLISFCLRFLILWTSRFINQISIRDTFFTNFYRGIMKQKLVLTKPPCNCPIYKIITLFGMNLELLVGLFLSNFWHYYNSPWWIWKEL